MQIPISAVTVPAHRHRQFDQAKCDALLPTIRDAGLIHPILVRRDHRLVAGLHRLRACEALGWTEIPARILEQDEDSPEGDLRAELAELDENLFGPDLTVLQRCAHLAERKRVYEELHPETRQGAAQAKAGGGKLAKDPDSGSFVPAFIDNTAASLKRSRAAVAEEVKIGKALAPDVQEALHGTDIEDSKGALKALADEPVERQRELVKRGKKAIKEAAKAKRAAKAAKAPRKKPSNRLTNEERERLMRAVEEDSETDSQPLDVSSLPDIEQRFAVLVERINYALSFARGNDALALIACARDCSVALPGSAHSIEVSYEALRKTFLAGAKK